jgi:hypothetical protein
MIQGNYERHFLCFKQLTAGNASYDGAIAEIAVQNPTDITHYFEGNSIG